MLVRQTINIKFNLKENNKDVFINTLIHALPLRGEKLIIQYFKNNSTNHSLNIDNKALINLEFYGELLRFNIILDRKKGLIVLINDTEIYKNEIYSWNSYLFILVGRPFFGKSVSTFFQFYTQCCLNLMSNIFIKTEAVPEPLKDSYKIRDFNESYWVKFKKIKSHHGRDNILNTIDGISMEAVHGFNQFHGLIHNLLCLSFSNRINEIIIKEIDQYKKASSQGEPNRIIQARNSLIDLYFYNFNSRYDQEIIDQSGELAIDSKETVEKILPYALACNIYFKRKEYSTALSIFSKLGSFIKIKEFDKIANIYRYYFLYFVSLTIKEHTNYGDKIIQNIIININDEILENDPNILCLAISIINMHFESIHTSHRGFDLKNELEYLVNKIHVLNVNIHIHEFALGILYLMRSEPVKSVPHLKKASNIYAAATHLLASAYEQSGNILECKNTLLHLIKGSNLSDPNNSLVKHYCMVCNWIQMDESIEYAVTLDTFKIWNPVKINYIEGLNFYSQSSVFIADHDFIIQASFIIFDPINKVSMIDISEGMSIVYENNKIVLKVKSSDNWIELSRLHFEVKNTGNKLTVEKINNIFTITCNDSIDIIETNLIINGGRIVVHGINPISQIDMFKLKIANYVTQEKSSKITIYSSWYGDEFTKIFFSSLIDSLNRSDGLSLLKDKYKVSWRIYISKEQYPSVINNIKKLHSITTDIHINCEILNSEVFSPREYLHETYLDCLNVAIEENSIILFAPPDHIFGAGLGNLINEIRQNEYVVCPHPRISYEYTNEIGGYKKLINNTKGIELNNKEMCRLAVQEYAHSIVNFGFNPGNHEGSYWWNASENNGFYSIRFKEPPPILFYATKDIKAAMLSEGFTPPFERVDHDIVDWMFKNNRLVVVNNNESFFWVEYCKDGRNYPTIMNGYWPKSAQVLYSKRNRWSYE